VSSKTLMSVAEFDVLPEREGWKVELNEGELVMSQMPSVLHGWVRDRRQRAPALLVALPSCLETTA